MAAGPGPGPGQEWVLPRKAAGVPGQAELKQDENPLTHLWQLMGNCREHRIQMVNMHILVYTPATQYTLLCFTNAAVKLEWLCKGQ